MAAVLLHGKLNVCVPSEQRTFQYTVVSLDIHNPQTTEQNTRLDFKIRPWQLMAQDSFY